MESLFSNWKPRASQFGYLMTSLPEPFTDADEAKLKALHHEKLTGINENGNKNKGWTDTKQAELDKYLKKKEAKDELPDGAITKLEEIFQDIFWKQKKTLSNKYLEKGIIVEEDSLDLLSDIDGLDDVSRYWKNDEQIENDYLQGCPDNIEKRVRDAKSNYNYFTFLAAEMVDVYKWQIKGYIWILISIGRDVERTGELCYCFVNTPAHRIESERKTIWYAMGSPQLSENDDNTVYNNYVEIVKKLERSHIADIVKFKEDWPNFDLFNTEWRIRPKHMRVKRFEVTLEDKDIEDMTRRSKMAKKWLIDREAKEFEEINRVEW